MFRFLVATMAALLISTAATSQAQWQQCSDGRCQIVQPSQPVLMSSPQRVSAGFGLNRGGFHAGFSVPVGWSSPHIYRGPAPYRPVQHQVGFQPMPVVIQQQYRPRSPQQHWQPMSCPGGNCQPFRQPIRQTTFRFPPTF